MTNWIQIHLRHNLTGICAHQNLDVHFIPYWPIISQGNNMVTVGVVLSAAKIPVFFAKGDNDNTGYYYILCGFKDNFSS